MTSAFRAATLVALALAFPQTLPARHVDRARLMRDVTTLRSTEFEGREAGSPGGIRARRWIVEQFSSSGVTPFMAAFEHPFEFDGRHAANVIGLLDGKERMTRTFLLTAHYDHLGVRNGAMYPGADDNASGVAALLAVLRHFKEQPPRHSFVVAALDAEEQGQRGAKALLASGAIASGNSALAINLDMVSRSPRRTVCGRHLLLALAGRRSA